MLLPAGTEALRTLGVARVEVAEPGPSQPPIAWAEALTRAASTVDLSGLESVRRLPRGGVALITGQEPDTRTWIVTSQSVTAAPAARNWMKDLHDGIWAAPWSGWVSLVSAGALLGLLGTGSVAWGRRQVAARRRSADAGADVLIAHASQTGTATRYAEATADALRLGGGLVAVASLTALQPTDLRRYRAVLLIVSTTGEGQVPEQGRGFVKALQGGAVTGVSFALLALGDRRYPEFCAGGEAVRAALVRAGARELAPIVRADGDPAEAWQDWLADVSQRLGVRVAAVALPEVDLPVALTLAARTRLDDPAHGGTSEVHSLTLESDADLDYRPGDLLLISPGNDVPERCYSLGSAPQADGRQLRLTVLAEPWTGWAGTFRRGLRPAVPHMAVGRPGRAGSGAIPRSTRRRTPAPDHHDRDRLRYRALHRIPCGAGRRGSRGASWMVFGNRHLAGDFLYGERLLRWLQEGVLARLDTAFSRDPEDGRFVQHRLLAHAADVWDWMHRRNAILYTCGGRATLGHVLDDVLLQVMIAGGALPPETAESALSRWQAEGRIRRDVID